MVTVIHTTLKPQQYKNNQKLTQITLDKSIRIIPRECFFGCKNLKKVIIPRSVRRIDFRAFANSGVQEIVFEEDSCLRVLSKCCFQYCGNLETISLPSKVYIIGDYCFDGCRNLIWSNLKVKLCIPSNAREIGAFAFSGCMFDHLNFSPSKKESNNKQKQQQNESKVLNIGYGAFTRCRKPPNYSRADINANTAIDIDSINVDNSTSRNHKRILNIGPNAFFLSEIDDVSIGNILDNYDIQTIGPNAFVRCMSLTSMKISSIIKTIGKSAFAASKITNVEFSKDAMLLIISTSTFSNCEYLNTMMLPSSVKLIQMCAFYESSIDDQMLHDIFSRCNIQHIHANAFQNCKKLRSIKISPTLQGISSSVFAHSSIEDVEFSQGSHLQILPDRIFLNCQNLRHVRLPASIKSIGHSAFNGSKIDNATLAHIFTDCNITKIHNAAFSACTNLISIIIPSSLISIGADIFSKSTIRSVEFLEGSKFDTIPIRMFSCCHNLSKVSRLPTSVTSISKDAFVQCDIDDISFVNIFATNNIQSIGARAFTGCTSLESIMIPSSITSIDEHAFCRSTLEIVEFSQDSHLETLPNGIFSGCANLRILRFSPSIKSIGNNAFNTTAIDDENFTNIFSTCNIEHIGDFAFQNCKYLNSPTIPPSVKSVASPFGPIGHSFNHTR